MQLSAQAASKSEQRILHVTKVRRQQVRYMKGMQLAQVQNGTSFPVGVGLRLQGSRGSFGSLLEAFCTL